MRRIGRLLALVSAILTAFVTSALAAPAAMALALPVLTSVTPSAGPLSPTLIQIGGKNLLGAKEVMFGTTKVPVARVLSTSKVEVKTPQRTSASTVSVRVRTASGWSAVTSLARYSFMAKPVLTAVTPPTGQYVGGDFVTLTGSGLLRTSLVTFGDQQASVVSQSATAVKVKTPIGVVGATQIRLTNPGGVSNAITFTFSPAKSVDTRVVAPVAGTFQPTAFEWVTGGDDPETGTTEPWVVSLPPESPIPAAGTDFYLPPGDSRFPSGLAGRVDEAAIQTDQSIRVTVLPTDLSQGFNRLALTYSGTLPASAGRSIGGDVATFPINASSLYCRNQQGQEVAVSADFDMRVADVDISQRLDLGSWVAKPTYDATLSAEIELEGKITVAATSTCSVPKQWQNMHRKVIPLGTSGATVSFAPDFELKISGAGTYTMVERTRTTYAVSARLGEEPRLSRTARSLESSRSGALEFEASISGGMSVRFGLLDRAGAEGRLLLVVAARLTAQTGQVCAEATLKFRISVGLFFDVWVTSWQSRTLDVTFDLATLARACTTPQSPVPPEPRITSARMPDAQLGSSYSATLAVEDGRPGTWSILVGPLPAGLSLASSTGVISGSPKAAVGDYPIVIQFVDNARLIATTTIRIRVQPSSGIGGGDIQVNLRWVGAADLDLHVSDPSGEEIYYAHPHSASGGTLDHDANAACNGPADDDNAVENVFWPPHAAPVGSYVAWVKVYATCSAPLDWHLTVLRGGRVIIDRTGTGDSPGYNFTGGGSGRVRTVPVPRMSYPKKR